MAARRNRILVVEDDPAVAHSLKAGLERDGYAVAWMASGSPAIAHARDQQPDLILLDIRLLDLSGFDVCRKLAGSVFASRSSGSPSEATRPARCWDY